MKFTCPTAPLLAACQKLQAVVQGGRGISPVYQNAKAVATPDRLVLMATDLEVGLRYAVPGVAVEAGGEAVLPLARLAAILGASGPGDARVEAGAAEVQVTTAASRYVLPTEPPEGFADVADVADGDPDAPAHEMAAGSLRLMIRRTLFAAAKGEDARFAMRGVLWDADGDEVRLAGTDAKRVAVAGRLDGKGDKAASYLLPPKAVRLLEGLLADADAGEVVRAGLRANDAVFEAGRWVVYTRLIEGRFPPYRDVFKATAKAAKTHAPLAAGDFLAAVRQAAVMTDETSKRLDLAFEAGKVTIRVGGASGTGEVVARMPDDGWEGKPAALAFEANWLTELFQRVDPAATVRLDIRDQHSGIFRVADDFVCLVTSMIQK